ncbi:MAG: hypothetical protein U1F11_03610 [Steroidobacteraceae bacterium]
MIATLRALLRGDAPHGAPPDPARRELLRFAPLRLGGLALACGEGLSAAPASGPATGLQAADDGFVRIADPRAKFEALFRIERDLREQGTTVSTYQFIMYALVPDGRPQPLIRWEGMEFSYFRRVADLTWRIHAHNVSYPRDLASGEFIGETRNPCTGERVAVEPMKLLGDPGVLHGPRGYLPLDAKAPRWLEAFHVLRTEGPLVKSEHIRPTPDGWPRMFIESSVSTVTRRDFDDVSVTAIPFQSSGFYVFPFPRWLAMGERPGMMLGAWSGRRAVHGVRDLPRGFRDRLGRENPELLEPRWQEFQRPLSATAREALES